MLAGLRKAGWPGGLIPSTWWSDPFVPRQRHSVTPAKAGTQRGWVPAFALAHAHK